MWPKERQPLKLVTNTGIGLQKQALFIPVNHSKGKSPLSKIGENTFLQLAKPLQIHVLSRYSIM